MEERLHEFMLYNIFRSKPVTPKEILALCKEKDVKAIDFRFMDFPGLWQHTTIPANQLDEDTFTDNGGEIIPRRIRTTPYINTTKAGPSLKSMSGRALHSRQ